MKTILLALCTILMVTGCERPVPNCKDPEVQATALKVFAKFLAGNDEAQQERIAQVLSLREPVAVSVSKNLRRASCQAEVSVREGQTASIHYLLEVPEDDSGIVINLIPLEAAVVAANLSPSILTALTRQPNFTQPAPKIPPTTESSETTAAGETQTVGQSPATALSDHQPELTGTSKALNDYYIQRGVTAPQEIAKHLLHPVGTRLQPSFLCFKASTATEQMICTDELLSTLDAANAENFRLLIKIDPTSKPAQKAFVHQLNACNGDITCITETYASRIDAMATALSAASVNYNTASDFLNP